MCGKECIKDTSVIQERFSLYVAEHYCKANPTELNMHKCCKPSINAAPLQYALKQENMVPFGGAVPLPVFDFEINSFNPSSRHRGP